MDKLRTKLVETFTYCGAEFTLAGRLVIEHGISIARG
jgi:hypothetical protein